MGLVGPVEHYNPFYQWQHFLEIFYPVPPAQYFVVFPCSDCIRLYFVNLVSCQEYFRVAAPTTLYYPLCHL